MYLHEKYRPACLDDVVGQDKAVEILRRVQHGGHAFYITGKSGTGKTTLARIVAQGVAQCNHGITEVTGRKLTVGYLQEWTSSFFYRPLFGGYALIVNESHGLQKPVIEYLLDVLEALPDYAVVIFTTTHDGNSLFEDNQLDSGPFQSRCICISLACRDIALPLAERAHEIATKEGLNGKPIEDYVKLMRTCRNNLRDALCRIEAGEML